MDQHFQQADFEHNMPVLLAMIGVWYQNFFDARVQAIIPYAHRLRYLIPYLQQADMESNGKGVDMSGNLLDYPTGPVLFGEEGVIGQHAYHQLLHQGKHFIPADFIVVGTDDANDHDHVLLASALSQAQALMKGKTWSEARAELLAKKVPEDLASELAHHQAIPGNKPSNIICLQRVTPKSLGALIALYEHKIFVQGVIWNVNSFDQWGVELGKQLLPDILKHLQGKSQSTLDSGTAALLAHLRELER
jgi:glucose-6-phosphate isomerase